MAYSKPPPPAKSKHRLILGLLLFVVVAGGIASFVMSQKKTKEVQEEIVIVDLAPPPPPPPPPPPEEEPPPEPAEESEPTEISDADVPDEPAPDDSDQPDLGLDAGDLLEGGTGSFVVTAPRIGGRRGSGGGGGGGLLGSDMDSPPTPVSKIQPNYPSSLLSKGIGGTAKVACVIDENGKVVSTSIRQSSGNAELDKAAVNAVTKWKFKPAQKGGRNMRATCVVPFNFEVKKN
jgi:periplasmic protein TonB